MTVRTGATEPVWPEKKGAKLIEYSELEGTTLVAPPVSDPAPQLPPDLDDRYNIKHGPGSFGVYSP